MLCVLCMRQMCEIICATASSFYKDLYSWPKRRDVGADDEGGREGWEEEWSLLAVCRNRKQLQKPKKETNHQTIQTTIQNWQLASA